MNKQHFHNKESYKQYNKENSGPKQIQQEGGS